MTPDRWLVLVGCLALIALIVWFFWMKLKKLIPMFLISYCR